MKREDSEGLYKPTRIYVRRTISSYSVTRPEAEPNEMLKVHKLSSQRSSRSKSVPRKPKTVSRAASDVQTETNDEEIEIYHSNYAIFEKDSQEEESPIKISQKYLI